MKFIELSSYATWVGRVFILDMPGVFCMQFEAWLICLEPPICIGTANHKTNCTRPACALLEVLATFSAWRPVARCSRSLAPDVNVSIWISHFYRCSANGRCGWKEGGGGTSIKFIHAVAMLSQLFRALTGGFDCDLGKQIQGLAGTNLVAASTKRRESSCRDSESSGLRTMIRSASATFI